MAKTEKITVSDTAWTELLSDIDGAAVIQLKSYGSLIIRAQDDVPAATETGGVVMDMRGVRQIAIDKIGAGGKIYGRASSGTAVAVVMSVGS